MITIVMMITFMNTTTIMIIDLVCVNITSIVTRVFICMVIVASTIHMTTATHYTICATYDVLFTTYYALLLTHLLTQPGSHKLQLPLSL